MFTLHKERKRRKIFPSCLVVLFGLFAGARFAAAGEAPAMYVVTADITAIMEEPGLAYEKNDGVITFTEGLVSPMVYGNAVLASPLTEGEFAGRAAEVLMFDPIAGGGGGEFLDDDSFERMGYVDMKDIAPLPIPEAEFSELGPCRFAVDSPELFLLPESFPVTDYTLPDGEPYRVMTGEVTDGAGTFVNGAGEWTLLRFASGRYEFGSRYAWTRSENVTRLSLHQPDNSKIDPALVPRRLRGVGPIDEKFYQALLLDGFAIDETPIIHSRLFLDDLVESYPDSTLGPVSIPNFITADLFLHAFHLVFSRSLKDIEESALLPALEKMLPAALAKLDKLEMSAPPAAGPCYERARDFLSVPAFVLDPESARLSERASLEAVRVLEAEGTEISSISGVAVDYAAFAPGGHYAASETLSRYFRAMAYLSGLSFPLTGDTPRDRLNTGAVALLCAVFGGGENENLRGQWESVYGTLACVIGAAPDPSIRDYGPIAAKILGGKPDGLADEKTLDELRSAFLAVPKAEFRLMGRRFAPDDWVFERLTQPNAGSGSAEAGSYQDLGTIPSARLDALRVYLTDRDSKQFFWNSPLWEKKKISTASASWAEMKHDKELYDKRNFFSEFTGEPSAQEELWKTEPFADPVPLGYVEPSPGTFGAIAAALERLLDVMNMLPMPAAEADTDGVERARARAEALLAQVTYFRDIAEKEVREEQLSRDDYLAVSQITSYLNSDLLLDSAVVYEEDSHMLRMGFETALKLRGAGALRVSVGAPRRVYVFVDDKWGGPRVTVGYAYSFKSSLNAQSSLNTNLP